jgi:O-antigen ligase
VPECRRHPAAARLHHSHSGEVVNWAQAGILAIFAVMGVLILAAIVEMKLEKRNGIK